jgi:hypothetical protein
MCAVRRLFPGLASFSADSPLVNNLVRLGPTLAMSRVEPLIVKLLNRKSLTGRAAVFLVLFFRDSSRLTSRQLILSSGESRTMRTVRRYFNPADAALARTLLDNYEIFCSLFDENANISVGPYVAAPIRLVVTERQLQGAARILAYVDSLPVPDDDSAAAEREQLPEVLDEAIFGEDQDEAVEPLPEHNNPWEILAISYLFLVPGIGFLLEQRSLIAIVRRWGKNRFLVLSPFDVHLLGTILICVAVLLVLAYLHTRTLIARNEPNSGD